MRSWTEGSYSANLHAQPVQLHVSPALPSSSAAREQRRFYRAAVQLQAAHRGRMVRRELEEMRRLEEELLLEFRGMEPMQD